MCQPGRPAPPRRRPGGLIRSRWLPEHEIERIALAGQIRGNCRARWRSAASPRGPAATAHRSRATRRGRSRRTPRPDRRGRAPAAADQLLHLRDVLGRAREWSGGKPVEGRHLGQEGGHVAVAERQVVLAELAGTAQHVVVDIGQVLHVDDVMAQVLQVPMQDVEADIGEGMAEVAGVVRGDAAYVQADWTAAERCERNLLAAQRVRTG